MKMKMRIGAPYHYEIPFRKDIVQSKQFTTIEECIEACKAECKELGVDYNDREVKLFMTDRDGTWEVTEEGELAG